MHLIAKYPPKHRLATWRTLTSYVIYKKKKKRYFCTKCTLFTFPCGITNKISFTNMTYTCYKLTDGADFVTMKEVMLTKLTCQDVETCNECWQKPCWWRHSKWSLEMVGFQLWATNFDQAKLKGCSIITWSTACEPWDMSSMANDKNIENINTIYTQYPCSDLENWLVTMVCMDALRQTRANNSLVMWICHKSLYAPSSFFMMMLRFISQLTSKAEYDKNQTWNWSLKSLLTGSIQKTRSLYDNK